MSVRDLLCICGPTRMIRGCPRHAPGGEANLEAIQAMLYLILTNQEKFMSLQDDINAAATALTSTATTLETVATDLQSAQVNIQAEIAALQAANPSVDTSALNAAVAGLSQPLADLQAADTAVDALETPAAPQPPAGG